jgi:FlaA1/EpsC-like NDP-sugar epimerase
MKGGEIYVKKIPSMKITDIAKAVDTNAKQKVVGIRPGEKLHEQMISEEDSLYTYEYDDWYKILPAINDWATDEERVKNGKKVKEGFSYTSNNNTEWVSVEALQHWIKENQERIGKI